MSADLSTPEHLLASRTQPQAALRGVGGGFQLQGDVANLEVFVQFVLSLTYPRAVQKKGPQCGPLADDMQS